MELPTVSDSWFDKGRRYWRGPWIFWKAPTDPRVSTNEKYGREAP